ncbi:MAG TPA: hypothetical protein VFA19_03825 [Gaiellaceae bacterium]|nr:hypothetical protein [Gaiellaceae bacterium]
MPAEAQRLRRGIARRDRRALAALACAVAAVTGGSLALGVGGQSPPPSGCVAKAAAGVVGGGTWRVCRPPGHAHGV